MSARALSVRAPWWWFLLYGGKDIENRNWPTRFRGTVYLHAGRAMPRAEVADDIRTAAWMAGWNDHPARWPKYSELETSRGCLVGKVDIVDCVIQSTSPWFMGKYGFVMENRVAFERPVPCLGALQLFPVPDEVLAQVEGRGGVGTMDLFGGGACQS